MDPIPLGMVGGGQGAFIGAVHRIAARLDRQFRLVAGALSSTPEKARASAVELGLDPARSYDDFRQMASREARRKDGIRAVAIVTPNHMHAGPAIEFLKRGIHVICDKPLTATMAEARRLAKVAAASKALFTELKSDPNIVATMASAQDGAPMPNNPEMGRFWSSMQSALQNMTEGRQAPKEALDAAAKRISAK